MSQAQSGSEAAPAALVGSLTTFSLVDVLDLLARTNHTGELQSSGGASTTGSGSTGATWSLPASRRPTPPCSSWPAWTTVGSTSPRSGHT